MFKVFCHSVRPFESRYQDMVQTDYLRIWRGLKPKDFPQLTSCINLDNACLVTVEDVDLIGHLSVTSNNKVICKAFHQSWASKWQRNGASTGHFEVFNAVKTFRCVLGWLLREVLSWIAVVVLRSSIVLNLLKSYLRYAPSRDMHRGQLWQSIELHSLRCLFFLKNCLDDKNYQV